MRNDHKNSCDSHYDGRGLGNDLAIANRPHINRVCANTGRRAKVSNQVDFDAVDHEILGPMRWVTDLSVRSVVGAEARIDAGPCAVVPGVLLRQPIETEISGVVLSDRPYATAIGERNVVDHQPHGRKRRGTSDLESDRSRRCRRRATGPTFGNCNRLGRCGRRERCGGKKRHERAQLTPLH